jgi:cell division transport system ATP-binding protein
MVAFHGVSKVYARARGRRVQALAGVSFELQAGELGVLVGPAGAGKSTVLRLITGEERPTRGEVVVDGVDVASLGSRGLARLRRFIGVVPHRGVLIEDRTALGNVAFVLRALGAGPAGARRDARQALAEVGLDGARGALARELSETERRRLLLARALATDPRLLLADEPTTGLEPAARTELAAVLRAAHRRGITCLVATQAGDLAAALAGRALRLEAGRLRPEGEAA